MEPDRLNSPTTSTITLEVLGHQLHFSQDPNSQHHGTTVWDASMVFAKFLISVCIMSCTTSLFDLKGSFSSGMALLGCDVVATDQSEVLPLLRRNVERNASRIMQMDAGAGSFGSIQVAELDWRHEEHVRALNPPFDYIIGTDVLGYEIRSMNVHEQMLEMWKRNFEVKLVPKNKMHSKYQHSSIQLYMMGLKSPAERIQNMTQEIDQRADNVKMVDDNLEETENGSCGNSVNDDDFRTEKIGNDGEPLIDVPIGKLSDWEARRVGSLAARLLRDVKVT
ncbi:hypothetical protein Tsubulata_036967 [Turnera subulata]|uniref:Uncharacterized protein n=1 Tax=Turnera subulata TaxID=218843 RepID=A0A9Q0GFJ0_9ROSI|nr:hypothetical protein Tsubulata_036967 [Turnera subulata]